MQRYEKKIKYYNQIQGILQAFEYVRVEKDKNTPLEDIFNLVSKI